MATNQNVGPAGLAGHYRRLLAARDAHQGAESMYESIGPEKTSGPDLSDGGIRERLETSREALNRVVERYLDNDASLKPIVEQIIALGSEGLRMVGGDDPEALLRNPLAIDGLEAIVRLDGSRPTFLVRDGEIDLASSPVGGWKEALEINADALRKAIASVGRIDVPGAFLGFKGTGFLIHRDLVLTNRHVLQASAKQDDQGRWHFLPNAAIDFGHEYLGRETVDRRRLKEVVFHGPRAIENGIDHTKLDLALIELEPTSDESAPRNVFSLGMPPSWARPQEVVVTIGYPGPPPEGFYPPTLLEQLFQKTFGYKRLAPGEVMTRPPGLAGWTLAHDATTLGGNSGSIVLRLGCEGAAAGIHYGGRAVDPRQNWGHVLGSVLEETDGKSPRTLREVLASHGVPMPSADECRPSETPDQPSPSVAAVATLQGVDGAVSPAPPSDAPRDWRHGVTLSMMHRLTSSNGPTTRLEAAGLEAPGDGFTDAESLRGRKGYDPRALPGWEVPLPRPAGDMRALRRGGSGFELKYEHFSVIMSASRRMPVLTACNIDGAESRRLPRISQWSYDGRLDREDQWGNELYSGNDLDRGHMVRREDPVWGPLAVARRANLDTFHYTNSCPQMAGVNQVTWLGLEEYILSHVREDRMRISVFTGPFFTARDIPYRGALVPRAFWKVVAFHTDDGRPSATAYKVGQARELQDLEFVFAGYKTYQISIQQVADGTGIDFGALLPFDGFSQHERVHGVTLTEPIDRLEQIRV